MKKYILSKRNLFIFILALIITSFYCGGGGSSSSSNNDNPANEGGTTVKGTIVNWNSINGGTGSYVQAVVYNTMDSLPETVTLSNQYVVKDGYFEINLTDNPDTNSLTDASRDSWVNASWNINTITVDPGVKHLNPLTDKYGAVICIYDSDGLYIGQLYYDKSNEEWTELQYVSGPIAVTGDTDPLAEKNNTHYSQYYIDISFDSGWGLLKFDSEGQNGNTVDNPEKVHISSDQNLSISDFIWGGELI